MLVKKLFLPYTAPHITKAKRGTLEIVCLLNKSFNFLLPKNDRIPKWILEKTETFWSFFAGYTDAEGSFFIKKPGKKKHVASAGYEIQTQQKNIINQLWKGLRKNEIICHTPKISIPAGIRPNGSKNNRDMWCINVDRKSSLWKFINYIEPYLKHQNKLKKVNEIKRNLALRGV